MPEASNIKVFIRVRPSARPAKSFLVPPESEGTIIFERERDTPDGQVNNTRTNFKFKFDGILNMKVTQADVFEQVARPVIDDVLGGINGTIFAYGQTGSGKTFTITGSAERYDDRGLIPRTISYIFKSFQRGDASYRLFISYLEIYNDAGYDLLSSEDDARKLEDLPKVQLREDEDGIHLKNLSVNMAQKEEDALNLLFLGDTNRVVAETPMNDASTRSHCMFILWVDSTVHGSDTVRRAKLHLVDLAGSERISKTGVEGNLQREARYINLSLHHLEQVIVALQERSQGHRTHVPYRNSTMTSVLRDSLGGNCKTVMVGTAAVEESCVDETISTCRFAARVACIKNNASINEELDPQLLIKRLKKEVSELKDELKLLSDDNGEDVTETDIEDCRKLVSAYLAEPDPEQPFVCGSTARFRECFRIMREVYWRRLEESPELADGLGTRGGSNAARGVSGTDRMPPVAGSDAAVGSLESVVLELRQQVAQRDDELAILVDSMRKKGGNRNQDAGAGRVFIKTGPTNSSVSAGTAAVQNPSSPEPQPDPSNGLQKPAPVSVCNDEVVAPIDSASLLLDRNKAFEVFRKSFRKSETQEDNKQAQQLLYAEAKQYGEQANAARSAMSSKQHRVEQLRMQRALEVGPQGEPGTSLSDGPEVAQLLREMQELKLSYQQNIEKLKKAKEGIQNYQRLADQNKQRLQQDFEAWYMSLQRSQEAAYCGEGSPMQGGTPANSKVALQQSDFGNSAGCGLGGDAKQAQIKSGSSRPPPVNVAAATETEALRSSMSSQASSADAFAQPTPAARGHSPMRAFDTVASHDARPPRGSAHGAWDSGGRSSSSVASSKGRPPRLEEANGGVPLRAVGDTPAASRPLSASASNFPDKGNACATADIAAPREKKTGDEQTDSDIAAYYAAFSDLLK